MNLRRFEQHNAYNIEHFYKKLRKWNVGNQIVKSENNAILKINTNTNCINTIPRSLVKTRNPNSPIPNRDRYSSV